MEDNPVLDFQWPWMALLPVAVLGWRMLVRVPDPQRREPARRSMSLLHPSLENLQSAYHGAKPARPIGSLLLPILETLLWLLLGLALMRPQWLERHTENRIEGYDLMVVVDVSRSMNALDFSVDGRRVSRMQVVKGVTSQFVAGRANDRVGLIIFGSQAFVVSPLTLDTGVIGKMLKTLAPRIAGDGTAIGDAIGLGVKKLRARPQGSRVLVLIADGENTAGTLSPLFAARLAARDGIRIYTIGVGSKRENVPFIEDGKIVSQSNVGFDEQLMRDIAETTGGAYFRGTDKQALEGVYRQIDTLEKTRAESRTVLLPKPLYRWPLGGALAVLLALGLFPNARARQWAIRHD